MEFDRLVHPPKVALQDGLPHFNNNFASSYLYVSRWKRMSGRRVWQLICVLGLMVFLLVLHATTRIRLANSLRDFAGEAVYSIRKQRNNENSFARFARQDSIFTKRVSVLQLKRLLRERRRIVTGSVKNTIVAACPVYSPVLNKTLPTWSSVRGVREIVLITYGNRRGRLEEALKLVDSVDRTGRVIHVVLVSSQPPFESANAISEAAALNLGGAVASGKNLLFVGCDVGLTPNLLSNLTLADRRVWRGSSSRTRPFPLDSSTCDLLYLTKQSFERAYGFDERINIPGQELVDLSNRLIRDNGDRVLFVGSRMMHVFPDNNLTFPEHAKRVWAADLDEVLERAKQMPVLGSYITSFALRELPSWKEVIENQSRSALNMRGVVIRVLREQFDSTRPMLWVETLLGKSPSLDFRLWIHATPRKQQLPSMLDSLSRGTLTRILLKGHRQYLHDQHRVPWKLLTLIEGTVLHTIRNPSMSSRVTNRSTEWLEAQISGYSPVLWDLAASKKKLLVTNIEAHDPMDMFVAVSWAIAAAVSQNRALIVAGALKGTPISRLLNSSKISATLRSEFNLSISIAILKDPWSCQRGRNGTCWSRDPVALQWQEQNLTRRPSGIFEESSQHFLMNIVTEKVVFWDSTPLQQGWQRTLEAQAFGSISISDKILHMASLMLSNVGNSLKYTPVLWISKTSQTTSNFVLSVLHERESAKGPRWLFLVDEINAYIIGRNKTNGTPRIVYRDGDAPQRDDEGMSSVRNLWVAMHSQKLLFGSRTPPRGWRGVELALLEWRRVQGSGLAYHSVTHMESTSGSFSWHQIEFDAGPQNLTQVY